MLSVAVKPAVSQAAVKSSAVTLRRPEQPVSAMQNTSIRAVSRKGSR